MHRACCGGGCRACRAAWRSGRPTDCPPCAAAHTQTVDAHRMRRRKVVCTWTMAFAFTPVADHTRPAGLIAGITRRKMRSTIPSTGSSRCMKYRSRLITGPWPASPSESCRNDYFVYWCVELTREKHRDHQTDQGRRLVFGARGRLAPPVQAPHQKGQGDGAPPEKNLPLPTVLNILKQAGL
jgi:hypothetical protein